MAAKPKRTVNEAFRAKSELRPAQVGQRANVPLVRPAQANPVSFATSQPIVKAQRPFVPQSQQRPAMLRQQTVQARIPQRTLRPANGATAPRLVQSGLPAVRQAGVSQFNRVQGNAPVSELIQTIQSPMGPLQIVTKQVNGKMIQLIRFNKAEPKGPSNIKKLLLAAIPGFFGVMGLSQLYQGKKVRGLAFLFGGLIASFISSWYLIIPARVENLLTHGTILPPYALSFLSSLNIDASLASKLSVDLLGVVAVVWALQLFDAMGPFFGKQSMVGMATHGVPRMPLPLPSPAMRRAITPTQSFKGPEIKPRA